MSSRTEVPKKRRCHNCGNVAIHEQQITPWVCCTKCGSQDTRLVKEPVDLTPKKTGYYWAQWKTASAGTHEGDQLAPMDSMEIVQVNENFIGDPCEADACEKFSVSVHGVRETQWLSNFKWGEFVAPLQ